MVRISNEELIRLLNRNARSTYVDLAKHFQVSETAVRKKMAKLEKEKVIRGYHADVDPRKLGYAEQVLIGVDTEPQQYMGIISLLKAMDEVLFLYSCSGDHMLIAECWFRTHDDLSAFIARLNAMPGVRKVCPAIMMDRIK